MLGALRSAPPGSACAPRCRVSRNPRVALCRVTPCSSSSGLEASTSASFDADAVRAPVLQSPRQLAALAILAQMRICACRVGDWMQKHRLQQLLFGGSSSLGGVAQPLQLMAALVLPALPGGGVNDIFTNRVFLAGFWAWFCAQTLKIFTKRLKKGVWDFRAIVDSGGMPSSHSALCAGITTAIAFQCGFGSPLFSAAVAFSSIVMYDAAGVRLHAGMQAQVLNQVVDELLEGHPISDIKLKEVLGHTPLQVGAGAVLGIIFGIFFPVPQPPPLAI